LQDPQNPSRNRGFAFVLYYNNACADYSRQKMSNSNFKLEGNTPTVTWADPKSTSDNSAAAQVYSDGNCRFMMLNQLLTDSESEGF
jgi:heterogeneous nuclear ribonucleoprotein R